MFLAPRDWTTPGHVPGIPIGCCVLKSTACTVVRHSPCLVSAVEAEVHRLFGLSGSAVIPPLPGSVAWGPGSLAAHETNQLEPLLAVCFVMFPLLTANKTMRVGSVLGGQGLRQIVVVEKEEAKYNSQTRPMAMYADHWGGAREVNVGEYSIHSVWEL